MKRVSAAIATVVFFLIVFATSSSARAAAPKTDVEKGQALLRIKGCVACHSTDGSPRVGPTFRGMWGRARPVQLQGSNDTETVTVDQAYLARSLRDPDAQIAAGYPRGNMPRFDLSDDDVNALAAALRDIQSAPGNVESSSIRGGSILPLLFAAALFPGLHFFLSSISVRKRLIGVLKPRGYSGLYTISALASFAVMIWLYRSAPYIEVWSPPRWTRWIPVLAMPIAILFMVAGFSTPSPTVVGQEAVAANAPEGIQAITRHPALWGFAIWAMAHLSTNGELHVILIALSIFILAIGGMLHIDARRSHTLGETWTAYKAQTSLIPFGALIAGRTRFSLSEIGWAKTRPTIVRVLIAGFIYFAILHTHALVIGASPFP